MAGLSFRFPDMTYSLNTLNADGAPPQSGLIRFIQEIWLLLAAGALLFWLLALVSHNLADPAWSTSGTGVAVRNWGGRVGAWLADLSYYGFGLSAWWLLLAGSRAWSKSVLRWLRAREDRRAESESSTGWAGRLGIWGGFMLLMCASTLLEWGWLYRFDDMLPARAGGALGSLTGPLARHWLGATGSVLLGLTLWLLAAALVFRFSWGALAERLGRHLESWFLLRREHWESNEDQRIGVRAARSRELEEAAYQAQDHHQPLVRTEPAPWDDGPATSASDSPAPSYYAAAPVVKAETPAAAPTVPVEKPVATLAAAAAAQPVVAPTVPVAKPVAPLVAAVAQPVVAPTVPVEKPVAPLAAVAVQPVVAPTVPVEKPVAPLAAAVAQPVVAPTVPVAMPVATFAPAAVQPAVAPTVAVEQPVPEQPMDTVPAAVPDVPPASHPIVQQPQTVQRAVQWADSGGFGLPPIDLLDPALKQQGTVEPETLEMTSRLIEKKLKDFGVKVTVVAAQPGPVITRYEIEPATGVKGSQVVNLAKDLARSLSLVSIRVIETIPGKNLMALELPNAKRQTIKLSEILGAQVYHDARSLLTMGLGKDIAGQAVVADLAKMPHCLVAGTTGSGKSVGINAMILSLLYKAEARDVRLMLIDPKMLELSVYEGIPHLLCPVVTDMKQAANGLNWCVAEMEKRYRLMSKVGVRNLAGYNAKIDDARAREQAIPNPFSLTPEAPEPLERLPHIVVVIDELADLMMVVGKKIEELIARLAQKARAAGIHLILATQRPSVDVITGLIKANIPTRLSFQVSSKIDSRTILDQMGAEALLGMGDMLYMPSGTGYPTRVHGAFVSDDEVHRVVSYLREQCGEPDYIDGVLDGGMVEGEGGDASGDGGSDGEKDPLYDQAVAIVLQDRKASISYVQRKLKIGYNRSARLLEDMENAGLVSALTSSGQRDILVAARASD